MTNGILARLRSLRGDEGMGIITVVFVAAVVTALTITAGTVTLNNLENSRRDRQGLAALATSEAGVSAAITRLRTGNLASLACKEATDGTTSGTCTSTTPSWSSPTNPMQVRLDGTTGPCVNSVDCFRVWIGTLREYKPNCSSRFLDPPVPCKGVYRVHATGVSGNGPGARQLAVDVEAEPYPFPMGVFTESFAGSGQIGVHRQSLFTRGCVQNRVKDSTNASGVRFDWDAANSRPVLDLIYDQPSSAHATGEISTANNTCGSSGSFGPIHNTVTPVRCNPDYPFDQSGSGASLSTSDTGCYGRYTRQDGLSVYPTTSKFDLETLTKFYGYRPRGLTDAQYDALRAQALAQGTLNIPTANISARLTALAAQGVTSPVLYWDTGSVSLHQNNFPSDYSRHLNTTAACDMKSVTIVVSGPGNNLSYQGGNNAPYLVASIFVPDGMLTGTGGRNTIGTVFAKQLDLSGGVDYHMDECFANNPPGATVDVELLDWREDDARDFNFIG